MTLILLIALMLIPQFASAEFDVEVGDVYYQDDGTPAIVISISEDRMQIITGAELYRKQKAEQDAWEAEQREIRRTQILEEILRISNFYN